MGSHLLLRSPVLRDVIRSSGRRKVKAQGLSLPGPSRGHRGGRVREDPFLGCLDPAPFVQLFGGWGWGGRAGVPAFQLRTVSPVGEDLPAVRSRQHLLQPGLCRDSTSGVIAAGRSALPGDLPGEAYPRRPPDGLPRTADKESDASRIPNDARTRHGGCCANGGGGIGSRRPRKGVA